MQRKSVCCSGKVVMVVADSNDGGSGSGGAGGDGGSTRAVKMVFVEWGWW